METSVIEIGPNDEAERLATEKQRTALIHGGIDRGPAEDHGLGPSGASEWLAALGSDQRPEPLRGRSG